MSAIQPNPNHTISWHAELEACYGIRKLNESNYEKQRDELTEKYCGKIVVFVDGELNVIIDPKHSYFDVLPDICRARMSRFHVGWELYESNGAKFVGNDWIPKPAPDCKHK